MSGLRDIRFWRALQEYGIDRRLLMAIKSFYSQPEVSVRVNGKQSKSFHADVGLQQAGCALPFLLFVIYMSCWTSSAKR